MRFLHTGDWHVGRSIRGRLRAEEFAAALEQVVAIAKDEKVDAVLIAGDLYDQRSAAPEADELVFGTFVKLYEARIPVVLIPGNHDSPVRLAALAKLLGEIDIAVVPRVAPADQGGSTEIPSRNGRETGLIVCVPFVPERRFGDAAALFDATEKWYESYGEGMGKLIAALSESFRGDRVNVLMAHLFTDGAMIGGGEREITIGMSYAISPSRLPASANYIALGHVHKPQQVKGAPATARYSGSLLQLDFGETNQQKSVAIVEASPGRPAKVREIPLSAGRRLVDIRGPLDEIIARAGGLRDAYVRAFVQSKGPVPGIADRVREAIPNALDVHLEYDRTEAELPGAPVAAMSPREQFLAYYETHHGASADEELLRAFDEVLELETEGA
ncbi:MAG: exonuclease SbcCD subunit D [Actinomycetota bacterium]